ncbi:MAG: hypothetical protein JJW00_04285 [Sulfurimonas sp.]|nr:hypothetical protein [Sulfurimonas sp.]
MHKMFLIFSHKLREEQKEDATTSLNIKEFVELPDKLQELWSNIPAELKSLDRYLLPLQRYIDSNALEGDVILIQGDYGATALMVEFCKEKGFVAVYSTTKREVKESLEDNKVIKTSTFKHVIFRGY